MNKPMNKLMNIKISHLFYVLYLKKCVYIFIIMSKFFIKETQLKRLVKNLIKEQENEKSVFSVNFQNAFPSGQYNFTPQYEKIVNDNILKIKQFVEGKKIDDFKLTISSGESQVPNPKGFEQKGSLARKRAEVLKGYLDTALPNLLNGMKPVVEILQPTVGRTEWNPNTDKKDDPKYTAEQFVNVNVVLTSPIEKKPTRKSEVVETVKMNNRQGNPSGIGFVMKFRDSYFDPNYGPRITNQGYEIEVFPSDTSYYRTVVNNNQKGLEDSIEAYKRKYKTDTVRRGTTAKNNYSEEGIKQMKLQNLFTPS